MSHPSLIDCFCHWFYRAVYHFSLGISSIYTHLAVLSWYTGLSNWKGFSVFRELFFLQKPQLPLCRQFQPWASTVGVTSTQYLGIKNMKLQNLKIIRSHILLQVCSLIFHQNGQWDNMARFRAWRKYLWWNTEVSFEIQLLYQFLYSCLKCFLQVLNCNL